MSVAVKLCNLWTVTVTMLTMVRPFEITTVSTSMCKLCQWQQTYTLRCTCSTIIMYDYN